MNKDNLFPYLRSSVLPPLRRNSANIVQPPLDLRTDVAEKLVSLRYACGWGTCNGTYHILSKKQLVKWNTVRGAVI